MSDARQEEQAEVFDFLSDFLDDEERGLRRPLREYLDHHPGHESAIAREWLRRVQPAAETERAERTGGDGNGGVQRIGPYVLVRELGRGGQGRVWLADDTRIARQVALKLLDVGAISSDRRARLRREAETVARLDHPGICHVYDAVVDGDTPYIAMRHVEGEPMTRSLSAALEEGRRDPIPWLPRDRPELERVLRLFERAARALHAAHEAGIVHRDVKPANLMITPLGDPVLLDFGLARDEEAVDERITLSGELFGTPGYTSPEQLGLAELDRRTDVWSLGVALYEALTGERPFEGKSRFALESAIIGHSLPNARAKNPAVSSEVWAVLQTALEKDRARRYATALELAEDLRRICEYEPIHARPAGPVLRLRRWSQRQPLLAGAVFGSFLVLAGALAVTLSLNARLQRQVVISYGRHLAERALENVDRDPGLALLLAIEAAEASPTHLGRSALFTALDACRLERVIVVTDKAYRFLDVELGQGRDAATLLAGALDDGTARLWDLHTGEQRGVFDHAEEAVRCVVLGRDGEWLMTGSEVGVVRSFLVEGVAQRWRVPLASTPILWMEARPQGDLVVALAAEGGAWLLAPADGAALAHYDVPAGEGGRARFSPDGSRLLVSSAATSVPPRSSSELARVYEVESAKLVFELSGHVGGITWSEWDPHGGSILTAGRDGTVRLWDAHSGEPIRPPLEHPDTVSCATFSPDGSRIATTTVAGEVRIWSLADGSHSDLIGHGKRPVVHASFAPDGRRLATACDDLSTRVWDVASGAQTHSLRALYLPAESLWCDEGRRLVTRNAAPRVHLWCLSNLPFVFPLVGHLAPVLHVAFDPSGRRALSASADGSVRVWHTPPGASDEPSLAPGECRLVFERHQGAVGRASFVQGGSTILSASADGSLRLFDAGTGVERAEPILHDRPLRGFALDEERDRVATLAAAGGARLYSLSQRRLIRDFEGVTDAAFAPEGGRLGLAVEGVGLLIVDAEDGRTLLAIQQGDPTQRAWKVGALAFRPGGGEVAFATDGNKLRFHDLATGEPLRDEIRTAAGSHLEYDARGARLLACGAGPGSLLLLDLVSGEMQGAPILHEDDLTGSAFDASGELMLSSSRDGSVYVWSTRGVRPLVERPGAAPVLCAAFGPREENPRLIVGYADGSAAVFPADPLPAARARTPRKLEKWEREREERLADPLPER